MLLGIRLDFDIYYRVLKSEINAFILIMVSSRLSGASCGRLKLLVLTSIKPNEFSAPFDFEAVPFTEAINLDVADLNLSRL